jgi:hypothetical protein
MASQRRRLFAALFGMAIVLMITGTSRSAFASPGCDAMNIPWQPVTPLMKALNVELAAGTYKFKGFDKGDTIVAKVSINHMANNQFADPNGYGELSLGAVQPGESDGIFVVPSSLGGFTYVVPADTPAMFVVQLEDVGGADDPVPHMSVSCTSARANAPEARSDAGLILHPQPGTDMMSKISGAWTWSCCRNHNYQGALKIFDVASDGAFTASYGDDSKVTVGKIVGNRISWTRHVAACGGGDQVWTGLVQSSGAGLTITGVWSGTCSDLKDGEDFSATKQ